ncbi:MAG: PIN/TRAM domain-containing protein [Dehalococcoidia bacterium]
MALELVLRFLGALALGIGGWQLSGLVGDGWRSENFLPGGLAFTLAGLLLGAAVTPYLTVRPVGRVFMALYRTPLATLVAGIVGLVVGLIVAALVSIPLIGLPGWPGVVIRVLLSLFLGGLGIVLGVARERDLHPWIPEGRRVGSVQAHRNGRILVDTSAIIDGRIADLTQTGFLQGVLVVPRFILDELRHIADSSDSMRRNRGRRGLEVLTKLRREAEVEILDVGLRNGDEADGKLVSLARSMHAVILTTDFNLNRVAELQGVTVLNVNELANALRPVVLPGEELAVHIIQEGKEPGQGVAFLDDGTMVVVEGGKRYINSRQEVSVTRVLQTSAGRIIFAQPKGS